MIDTNSTFYIHNGGSNIAIGIQGEDAESIYHMFYMYGATNNPEGIFLSDKFIYFWTQPERFQHAVEKIMINRLENKNFGKITKGKQGGFIDIVRKLKDKFMNKLVPDNFLPMQTVAVSYLLGELDSKKHED